LATPIVAKAQIGGAELRGDAAGRTFGTNQTVAHTIQAFAFTRVNESDPGGLDSFLNGARFCRELVDRTACLFGAAVFLPAGAAVEGIGLDGCVLPDFGGSISVTLRRVPVQSFVDGHEEIAGVSIGGVFGTGCGGNASFPAPHTVDNNLNAYHVILKISNGTVPLATSFQAVRIYYRLQVSPPPAVATFNDVPTTHPFFRLIEALAASGITAGCSTNPPLFCPDDVVTRKQIAAFFARALGLHWAP